MTPKLLLLEGSQVHCHKCPSTDNEDDDKNKKIKQMKHILYIIDGLPNLRLKHSQCFEHAHTQVSRLWKCQAKARVPVVIMDMMEAWGIFSSTLPVANR